MRPLAIAGCFVAIVLAAVGLAYGAGVRVIVIQPIGAIPDGVTVVTAGLRNTNFIDSPDAICQRRMGGVSLMCRAMTAASVAREGKILFRLPYSSTLFKMSGAPELDR